MNTTMGPRLDREHRQVVLGEGLEGEHGVGLLDALDGAGKLGTIKGIKKTDTMLAFKAFSKHDLESMFSI